MTALAIAGALLEASGRRTRRRARGARVWLLEHAVGLLTAAGVVLLGIALGWLVVWLGSRGVAGG